MEAVLATIVASGVAWIWLIIEVDTNITIYNGLGKYIRKAALLLGGMDLSNPRCWRSWRLHHHGGDVCCVFVLCVVVSSGRPHSSYVDKDHMITLR
jgi:hypothetical protein